MWCIPTLTPEYITAMMRVLGVYERTYDPDEPVVCVDEKSKQLLEEARPQVPAKPGRTARVDSEYIRHGTVNIFVAVEPKGNRRVTKVTKHRKRLDMAGFIHDVVTKVYRKAKKISFVMDQLNIHMKESLREGLTALYGQKEADAIFSRCKFYYTPKHGSWLNMAEIEISVMSKQCLGKYISTIQKMRREVAAWTKNRNRKRIGINWQFTREKAKQKFKIDSYEN